MTDRIAQIQARLDAWTEKPCGSDGQPMAWPTKSGGCVFCDMKIAEASEDFMEQFSRPFIVCPECGNKRCPKAQWHRNECSGSNESGQTVDYPKEFAPEDVAFLLSQLAEVTEAKARAWDKGYNLGHHDGTWHYQMRFSHTNRPDKSRRNPYRFDGDDSGECGCGAIEKLVAQRDQARDKLAEAWYEGVDAALYNPPTQMPANPYLLPGEDGR